MTMRRLVLLCDGTWSQPESDTNVERLRRLIATRDAMGIEQRINYLPGVGIKPGIGHWLGGAFGYGFADTVKQGYRWLCDTWQADDELYLIGYSRGAYAARDKVGLKMNLPENKLAELLKTLPSLRNPTVAHLAGNEWVAVETIIDESVVREIIPQLKALGAEGIIEYPLNKVVY